LPVASAASSAIVPVAAPPLTGEITPAIVQNGPDSITHYLHFPKDPALAKHDSVVQFYCDVSERGTVETTYGVVGNDKAFRTAVQSALDWGRFQPATVDGRAVPAYVGGTVFFWHENAAPVIVVSLGTEERDRVGKMTNYIQPQLIGGLRRAAARVIRQIPHNFPVDGQAEVVVNVDEKGVVKSTKIVGEHPKGSGLGHLLERAIEGAQFTHGFENGKATAGSVNVVADFSLL
jgi:hypothetical protein